MSLFHGLGHTTCKTEAKNNFFTLQPGKCRVTGNLGCDDVQQGQDYRITDNYSCDKNVNKF
jgi:hypothetical protein